MKKGARKPVVPREITEDQLFQAAIMGATLAAFQTSPLHQAVNKEPLLDRYVENILKVATKIVAKAREHQEKNADEPQVD